MSRQRVVMELPVVSALLFAGDLYSMVSHYQESSPASNPPVNNRMGKVMRCQAN